MQATRNDARTILSASRAPRGSDSAVCRSRCPVQAEWQGPARTAAVHPRACGEQHIFARSWCMSSGSSPRVRGTANSLASRSIRLRFIPARAGNSPERRRARTLRSVHPRACGEQGAP